MAEQEACVAINNALQKFNQKPNFVDKVEKVGSVKLELRRLGSHLSSFNPSELTQVREVAYDVEDAMDDVIMAVKNTEQQGWRAALSSLCFSRADKINQRLAKQMGIIGERTGSIGSHTQRSSSYEEKEQFSQGDILPEKDLAYLSLSAFPAGVHISSRKLIQIWLADGFLGQQGSSTQYMRVGEEEEEGKESISWLINKKMIIEVEAGTCGTPKILKIVTHKLNACVLAAEEENYLQINSLRAAHTPEARRRLAIHDREEMMDILSHAHLSKLLSLHIHFPSNGILHLDCETSKWFLKTGKKGLHSLRVLDLGGLELETIPEVVGKLTHLRYLRLRAPDANRIPPSICNLHNLQTIDMTETTRVKSIPVEIWKMKNSLRHLHLGSAATFPAPRRANHYDALDKLQTLCGVCPDKELKRLMVRAKFPNVNRLRLHANKNNSHPNKVEFVSFLNSLDHLYHLRSLTLRGEIEDFPSDWNAFPPSLTKMTLYKTQIKVNICVGILQSLPNLRYLKLMKDSITGTSMECGGGGFPALQVLRMESLRDLETWKMEKGAMRYLRDVQVRECQRLQRVEAVQPSKELREALKSLKESQLHGIREFAMEA